MCTQMYVKLFQERVAITSSDRLPTRRLNMCYPHQVLSVADSPAHKRGKNRCIMAMLISLHTYLDTHTSLLLQYIKRCKR